MGINNETQKRIEEVMDSLSGIERQEPAPFFYTRVQARLMGHKKNIWESLAHTISRPVVAFASLAFIILMNSFVIFSVLDEQKTPERAEVAVVDEYSNANSFYDLENIMQ